MKPNKFTLKSLTRNYSVFLRFNNQNVPDEYTFLFFMWTPGYERLYLRQEDCQILWKEVMPGILGWDPRICHWVRKEIQDWVGEQGKWK